VRDNENELIHSESQLLLNDAELELDRLEHVCYSLYTEFLVIKKVLNSIFFSMKY